MKPKKQQMLQILISPIERYSLGEQAQMAIEAGCGWIVLDGGRMEEADLREQAAEVAAVCTENGVILTFDGHTELARKLGVHGVLTADAAEAVALRAQWGAEAILGARIDDVAQAAELAAADIDYAVLPQTLVAAIAGIRTAGVKLPVVAMGNISREKGVELRMAGFDGICSGPEIFEAPDPVAYIKEYLEALNR